MDKRFWGILAVIVLVFGGIFFFAGGDKANAPSGSASGSTATNHTYGEGKSGVRLVEYGDFQCPACAQFYPVVKQLKETYKDDIVFQFRHYPLYQLHPNAIAASRAAEAASLQDKFWEMHDLLYENQQSWSNGSNPQREFEQYASQLGLNVEKFKSDYRSTAVNNSVQADMKEGDKLKVTATPTFILDGKKIENPGSPEAFSKLIEDAIKAKGGSQSSTQSTGSGDAAGTVEAGSGQPGGAAE